jgi:hypothetical protein
MSTPLNFGNPANERSLTFKLDRYRTTSDPGFAEALTLYSSTISGLGLSDPEEIAYWVDRNGLVGTTAEARCCGYKVNGELVGFAHWGLLKRGNFAFLDYLALREDMRDPAVLANFLSLLTTAVKSSGAQFVMTEVLADKALTRFCRLEGFQEIIAPYFQPPLGEGVAVAGTLMVLGWNGPLAPQTYVQCVEEIYRGYYQPWHRPFLTNTQGQGYVRAIDELISRISAQLGTANLGLKGGGLACLKEEWNQSQDLALLTVPVQPDLPESLNFEDPSNEDVINPPASTLDNQPGASTLPSTTETRWARPSTEIRSTPGRAPTETQTATPSPSSIASVAPYIGLGALAGIAVSLVFFNFLAPEKVAPGNVAVPASLASAFHVAPYIRQNLPPVATEEVALITPTIPKAVPSLDLPTVHVHAPIVVEHDSIKTVDIVADLSPPTVSGPAPTVSPKRAVALAPALAPAPPIAAPLPPTPAFAVPTVLYQAAAAPEGPPPSAPAPVYGSPTGSAPTTAAPAVASAPVPADVPATAYTVVSVPSRDIALVSSTVDGHTMVSPYKVGQALPDGKVILAMDPGAGALQTSGGAVHAQ